MYFIMTLLAAIISTIIWYVKSPDDKYKLGLLSLIYWGATLMWFVDHIMAFIMEGGEFLEISLDATMLGITVVILGLLVWVIILVISDPKSVLKTSFKR